MRWSKGQGSEAVMNQKGVVKNVLVDNRPRVTNTADRLPTVVKDVKPTSDVNRNVSQKEK